MLCDVLPEPAIMQRVASEVGYSETIFAAPAELGWRARYFSPECEVPFCGHATIALGAVLATAHGDGVFTLQISAGTITVEGRRDGFAALQSPPTRSAPLAPDALDAALKVFGLSPGDLDPKLPPALVHAGANHAVLALHSRATLRSMRYDLEDGRRLMQSLDVVTIMLVHAETDRLFHARNPFASSGIYEDPATGAAAAALGGYLRDLGWPRRGRVEIIQGADMGMPCRLHVDISPVEAGSIRVSGATRIIQV